MKFKRFTGSALGFLTVGGVAWGCSSQASDCTANENCGAYVGTAGDASGGGNSGSSAGGSDGKSGASAASGSDGMSSGGEAGGGGAAGAGVTPCDTTSAPTAESCLVTDDYGVFVSPDGDDTNAGSMSAPVATIAQAIELAQGAGKFVIACDGTYDEQVSIAASVAVYGGFVCPGGSGTAWQAESGRAKVSPSVRGIALNIKSSTAPVSIENFEFDAQDGANPGESSVAALLNGASKVTFTNVKLVAGRGVAGANGTLTPATFPSQTTLNGNAASGDTGGAFNLVTCAPGVTTKGGRGGDGGLGVAGGSPGTPALGGGDAGLLGQDCGTGGSGLLGTNANPQLPAASATKLGNLTATGWTGFPGADGTPGTPGQGGGGGTGAETGGGGGGGGAGGCGGAGGTGGKAGGSSIALALLDSSITLNASELVAVAAGKGGDGASGQDGQSIAANGGLPDTTGGCQGGKGGKGGDGGMGGGGAGGISVGIAYQDSSPPVPDADTVITVGEAGIGGVSGATSGIDGSAQSILELP